MLRTTSGILSEIFQHKIEEVTRLQASVTSFETKAWQNVSSRRPFAAALRAQKPAIIAEIKKASPSKGLLQADFEPATIARTYAKGGAACLSVLTDAQYFQGSLADLHAAREAAAIPVLRKDFTIDQVQIFEAAAHGADAILLIAAILTTSHLREFRELATELKMAALVEVHNETELESAIDSGAELIGVNNRNLETFEVTLETSLRLAERIPAHVLRVSESGIQSRRDIEILQGAGFHAFLIGEWLMKSPDPRRSLESLSSPRMPVSPS